MGAPDDTTQFGLWIASAVAGTGAGVVGLVQEHAVIESLPEEASTSATTLTTAFVVGAVVGLTVTALQVACAILARHGHPRAGTGLLVLAGGVLTTVVLRLTTGEGTVPAATLLLTLQAVLLLAASARHLRARRRSRRRTPTGSAPVR